MTRQDFLDTLEAAILKDRNVDYGDPEDNFKDTADIWNVHLRGRMIPGKELGPADVAVMMIGVKLARVRVSPNNVDHWVDIGGYAGCGVECIKKDKPT